MGILLTFFYPYRSTKLTNHRNLTSHHVQIICNDFVTTCMWLAISLYLQLVHFDISINDLDEMMDDIKHLRCYLSANSPWLVVLWLDKTHYPSGVHIFSHVGPTIQNNRTINMQINDHRFKSIVFLWKSYKPSRWYAYVHLKMLWHLNDNIN